VVGWGGWGDFCAVVRGESIQGAGFYLVPLPSVDSGVHVVDHVDGRVLLLPLFSR